MRRFSLFAALAACALTVGVARADVHQNVEPEELADVLSEHVPGADALDGRIRAPCCWNQTIDIHGSEVSIQLRQEIRRRLKAGESADAIQASFVERYGERILAVPPGSPVKSMGVGLLAVMAGAGVGGFFMLKRWRRRGGKAKGTSTEKPPSAGGDDRLDARLDAELRALDE